MITIINVLNTTFSALTTAYVRPSFSLFLVFQLHSSAASQRIESLPHRAPEGLSSIRSDQPTTNAGSQGVHHDERLLRRNHPP